MHILLIEDHVKLADNIKRCFELEDFRVTVCNDGKAGFEKAMTDSFDLVVLDINLPGMDGYVICSMLRQHKKNMPIIMLTARDKQQEIVHGLNIGADDYLVKPFDIDELVARVRALMRRNGASKTETLSTGNITLDQNTREVQRNGRKINLSPKEYALFLHLLLHKGSAQDRPSIIESVWGGNDDLMFSQTVDVHVAYLRRKLGKQVIQTVPGKGYMIPVS